MSIYIPTWFEWFFWPGLVLLNLVVCAYAAEKSGGDGPLGSWAPLFFLFYFPVGLVAILALAVGRLIFF